MRRAAACLLLASASAAAFVLTLWVARDTAFGLRTDAAAVVGVTRDGSPRIHDATLDVLRTIDVSSLALVGSGLIGLALLRRRVSHAAAVAVLLLGANVTTQVLKPALGDVGARPDDVAGGSSFPSGHATVAMSLALAAVIAAPAGMRATAAILGAAYAAAVGVALVALGWHYPSDVVGGYLVSTAWAACVAAVLVLAGRRKTGVRAPGEVSQWQLGAAAVLIAAGFGAAVAVAASRLPELVDMGRAHTTFFVASGALGLLSLVLAAVTAALLQTPSLRPR